MNMKKLFTLLTLLVAMVTSVWADVDLTAGASYDFTTITTSSFTGVADGYWTQKKSSYYENDDNFKPSSPSDFLLTSTSTITAFDGIKINTDGGSQRVRIYYGTGSDAKGLYLNSTNAKLVFPDLKKDQTITIGYTNVSSNEAGFTVTNATASQNTETHVETLTVSDDGDVTLTYNSNKFYIETIVISAAAVSHSVTAVTSTGDDSKGTVSAANSSVGEGSTTLITAVPASGYKVTNWAVSGAGATISPSGASNSLTTTLTMGMADATVTCTFGAAETYTVTHNMTNVTKTSGDASVYEYAAYTAVYSASAGYVLPDAITVTIGGITATEGTEYTWDTSTGTVTIATSFVTGAIAITITGTAAFTLTYDANGGTGTMENTLGIGSVTLTANAYTKTGYSFVGWATTQANADAGIVAYTDGTSYTLSADATIYAVWIVNDYSFAPTESSGDISDGDEVATSIGGKMIFTKGTASTTLKYSTTSGTNCIEFGSSGSAGVTVTLDKVMQVGTVITLNYYCNSATARGFYLANSEGTNKATFSQTGVGTYTSTYNVVAGDGLAGSNKFIIKRNNTAYLNTLVVANCEQAVSASFAASKEFITFASTYPLDCTMAKLPDGLKVYKAISASATSVTIEEVDATVAAGTGLLLQRTGDTSSAGSFNIPIVASGTDISGTNKLVGVTAVAGAAIGGDGIYDYILNDGKFYHAESGTIAQGKAYLHLDADPAGARSLDIDFGGTTGIKNIKVGTEDNIYYDLQGRRVLYPTKGLYIVNGKKVIIK